MMIRSGWDGCWLQSTLLTWQLAWGPDPAAKTQWTLRFQREPGAEASLRVHVAASGETVTTDPVTPSHLSDT